jgi:hypothetical protein
MGRFASTVAYYESARPPYGAAFFYEVAVKLGFDRSQRLLDVGAGPGILAIGFAPYCGEIVGVDPEPAMIEAARSAAARAGVAAKFIEGRVEDMGRSLGAFDSSLSVARSTGLTRSPPIRPSIGLSRHGAGFSSATRKASKTAAIPGSTPSMRFAIVGRTTGRRTTSTLSSPADGSSRAGRSALRPPMQFTSSASPTACCRCRPRRRTGSASKFPQCGAP